MSRELFGRAEEARIIGEMLDSAMAGTGASALVEGIIGAGKTSMLRWGEEMARQRGMLVLSATAAPTERRFSMGVMHQILDGLDRAGRDLGLFVGERSRERAAEPSQGIGHDFPDYGQLADSVAALSEVAQHRPLLITVDCIHCVDPQSLLWLGFLSRRLDGLPVVLLASKRRGEPASDKHLLVEFMEGIRPERRIHLPDLPAGAASDLVASLGVRVPGPVGPLIAESGGNPGLLTEQVLAASALTDPGAGPEHPAGHESAELMARMHAVKDRMLCFIKRLDPNAVPVAYAASVAGRALHPELAAELCGSSLAEVTAALGVLTESGLLHGTEPAFRHPILARLLYADIPAAHRADLHLLTARCLHRRGAARAETTPHLLRAARLDEPWMAHLLLDAAQDLLPGDAEEAMVLIDKVLRADEGDGAVRYGQEAAYELELRTERLRARALTELDLSEAVRVRTALVERVAGHRERAEEALLLAGLLLRLDEPLKARQALERAHERVRGHDEAAAARLRELLAHVRLQDGTCAGVPTGVERLESLVLLRTARGEAAPAVRRMCHTLLATPRSAHGSPSWYHAVLALLWAGGFEEALRHLDAEVGLARAEGGATRVAEALAVRSLVQLHRGLLEAAGEDAGQAAELLEGIGADRHHVGALARSVLIDVALERNQVDRVGELLQSVLPLPSHAVTWWRIHLMHSAARALGRLGQTQRAFGLITYCEKELRRREVTNPAILPWRSTKALLYAGTGNLPAARRLAKEEAECARRFAAPFALGRALTALASVTSGGERTGPAVRAVELLEPQQAPLLFARALYAAGQAHQEGGDSVRARELLHRANEMGISLGAEDLVQLAQRALRGAGGRPDPRKASVESLLTPAERQVARLAAQGLSNRGIARMLHVSLRNVESHLTHAYRKLRIGGRRELVRFFPERQEEPGAPALEGLGAVPRPREPQQVRRPEHV